MVERMTHWHTPVPTPRWALFLDVDGTLLDFAADPAAVRVDASLLDVLARVRAGLGGALALVSGRAVDVLDALFAPLELPAAGLHGLERRPVPGRLPARDAADVPAIARTRLAALVSRHPGLMLEDKGATLAVHYRLAPDAEPHVRDTATELAATLGPGWMLQPGACVLELKPSLATKGTAVVEFMRDAPFAGRRPVYVGDDCTDRHGFAAAESLGGEAIAVGDRVQARWRLPEPAATRAWLARVAAALADARQAS